MKLNSSKSQKVVQDLLSKAEMGDVEALTDLGAIYEEGKGVTRDLQLAERYYLEASEKGSANAANKMGVLCWQVDGYPKDLEVARQWFSFGAQNGSASAMFNLGATYYTESPPNYDMAQQFFANAVKRPSPEGEGFFSRRLKADIIPP